MADNFVESSFVIEILSPEELAWWKKKGEQDTHPYKEWELIENDTQVWFHEDTYFDGEEAAAVSQSFRKEWELIENDTQVWFHEDTNFDVEEAAAVIQSFLKECRPKGSCGFSWALSCSKPRLDEFGGGACFVTAQKVWWHSYNDWLQDKYRQAGAR